MAGDIIQTIDDSIKTKLELKKESKVIYDIGTLISKCINKGGKVFFFGNGGSAADAQHISAELVGRYQIKRKGLPSIAFTTNTSVITAISNDFGYDVVFERQVKSIVSSDDIVVGISTSGTSANIINGIIAAKNIGAKTVGLTGLNGAKLAEIADITLKVPSTNTQRIQECHIMIGHIICDIVEEHISERFEGE